MNETKYYYSYIDPSDEGIKDYAGRILAPIKAALKQQRKSDGIYSDFDLVKININGKPALQAVAMEKTHE